MKGYIILGIGISLTILLMLMIIIPSTDDFSPDNPLWNGLTSFYHEFNASIVDVRSLSSMPREAVLLIIGPSYNLSIADAIGIRRLVEGGMTLIIADDFGSGNSILEDLGISTHISGKVLRDEIFMYRSPSLPRAIARINNSVFELYLNYPSTIEPDGKGICIAYSSPFSYLDINLNGIHDDGEPYGPFCIIYMEPLGSGKVFIISDPSIFINSMIGLGGNLAMMKSIVGSRNVYILTRLWSESRYTYVRSLVIEFLSTAYGSSLRYVSIPLTGLLIYFISLAIYKRAQSFARGVVSR